MLRKYRLPIMVAVLGIIGYKYYPVILEQIGLENINSLNDVAGDKISSKINIKQNKAMAMISEVDKDKIAVQKLTKTKYSIKAQESPFETKSTIANNATRFGGAGMQISALANSRSNTVNNSPSVKAIAKANGKYVAVIEFGGKTYTAKAGSSVGTGLLVTEITGESIVVNNNGTTQEISIRKGSEKKA